MNKEIYNIEQELNILRNKQNKSKQDIDKRHSLIDELGKALREEASSLIKELNVLGLNVTSVYDLVNTSKSYPEAIPILLNHVTKNYHDKNKEGIIRALSVREAKGKASSILIEEYNRTPKDKMNLRWVIGNAILVTFTEDDVESILLIVQDKTNGMSRDRFIEALGKTKIKSAKAAKVENVLIGLLDDEGDVISVVLKALRKIKSKGAKEKISMLTNHSNSLIRMEAQNALKKIR